MRRVLRAIGADSLAGRTVWLLVGGLGLLHVGSMAVHERALHGAELSAFEVRAADRILAAGALAATRAPSERDATLRAMSLPGLALQWSEDAPPGTTLPEGAFAELRMRLAEAANAMSAGRGRPEQYLHGAWPVPGGGWVVFQVRDLPSHGLPVSWHDWLAMGAMAVGILLAAIPIVAWMTGPLRRLAAAADRVGRDPRSVQMATDGPAEVRHAAQAFNRMQSRIARLIEDRTEALAALSHDLRTPLARLRLRAGFLPEGDERMRIEAEVAEMEAMVSGVLDYFREGRDAEPTVPTDLAAILQTLADEAADAGADVRYEGPDRLALALRRVAAKRAFRNLLDNALVHGAPPVVLSLRTDGEWVVAELRDHGRGIAAEDRGRAVQPFTRLDPSRGGRGVGLGLATAARFALAEGGELSLHAPAAGGQGLVVRVALPQQ